ncbi:sulfatase-like hydrolase/transferase [Tichowtungia aerotolerans]|uniref:Sulfatase-like hydrolase/transferase n=1 Tax=Tichowtungia aerotolerans TaxID=2697043 RepID=A0A6P1M702_9BACT|nr:sulfatase-like hydrolase/transferase [Tichowtungia aerotolerans]QHI68364.1 sulfatase-like hydrolase/transferase [Tichowtungia aerotolerans]
MKIIKPVWLVPLFAVHIAYTEVKPNIIMIYADDMGYGDAGCYGGSNLVPTPNIDRLAAEGVRFTDGYVTAPVCGPSRYGLLSGIYQQRLGIQWNNDAYAVLPGRVETLDNNRIPSSQKLIHQTLEAAGYATGMAGKWNLPCYPKTSFQESMSIMHFGGNYFPDADGHYGGVDEAKAQSNFKRILWGPERAGDEYLTDRLGRQSVEFIDRHAKEPFFLYLAFNAPHSPLQAKKSHRAAVAHLPSEALRYYGAMLLSMDENVGKVLDALDRHGLTDNTIVAFVSDNGPTFAYNAGWPEEWPKELLGSAGPLNGHKGQYMEGGIRVPYIIRWPARLKGGQVYNEPVNTLDLYPTFCAAAGAAVADGTQLDGVNLLPFLNNEKAGTPHDLLFWHSGVSGAVRRDNWKLYVYQDLHRLFDLREDIGETNDLSQTHPETVAVLLKSYQDFVAQLPPPVSQSASKTVHKNSVPMSSVASPARLVAQNAVAVWSEYPVSTSRHEGDLLVGNNKPGEMFRALLDFDLSAVPAGAVVQSVELQLYQMNDKASPAGAVDAGLYLYDGSVVENETCWNHSVDRLGARLQKTSVDPSQKTKLVFESSPEMIDAVQAALDSGSALCVAIRLEDETADRRVIKFRGNEYDAEVSRPSLIVLFDSAE